ncbi:hypothetical protein CMV_024050, partial [Castanea mollissima]
VLSEIERGRDPRQRRCVRSVVELGCLRGFFVIFLRVRLFAAASVFGASEGGGGAAALALEVSDDALVNDGAGGVGWGGLEFELGLDRGNWIPKGSLSQVSTTHTRPQHLLFSEGEQSQTFPENLRWSRLLDVVAYSETFTRFWSWGEVDFAAPRSLRGL